MPNEARVNSGLSVRKVDGQLILLDYQSRPASFTADVSGTFGPTPGAFVASVAGTDADLTGLTVPGFCWMQNMDSLNFVQFGVWDPETEKFYPVGELLPGESCLFRLSRNLGVEYEGTGSGTTGPTNRLRFKADTSPCNVRVDAFER